MGLLNALGINHIHVETIRVTDDGSMDMVVMSNGKVLDGIVDAAIGLVDGRAELCLRILCDPKITGSMQGIALAQKAIAGLQAAQNPAEVPPPPVEHMHSISGISADDNSAPISVCGDKVGPGLGTWDLSKVTCPKCYLEESKRAAESGRPMTRV